MRLGGIQSTRPPRIAANSQLKQAGSQILKTKIRNSQLVPANLDVQVGTIDHVTTDIAMLPSAMAQRRSPSKTDLDRLTAAGVRSKSSAN